MENHMKSLIVLIFFTLQLSSCDGCHQEERQLKSIDFKLNWSIYGEHAPFFIAKHKGFYEREGLNVNIIPGNGSGSTTKLISDGVFKIGYADSATQIKLSVDAFATKSVAVFTQTTPMALVKLKTSSIEKWQDIKGKRIGMTISDAASALFKIILGKLQLEESDVEILTIATPHARGKALLQKRIDGFFGYYINEPHKLEFQFNEKLSWLPITDLGINFLSSSIIVNLEFLDQNQDIIKSFVKASQLGLKFTIDHPDEAADILAKYTADFDKPTSRNMVKSHLPLVSTKATESMPLGWTTHEDWVRTIQFLQTYYSFRGAIEPEQFYTNEFLSDVKK